MDKPLKVDAVYANVFLILVFPLDDKLVMMPLMLGHVSVCACEKHQQK